MKLVETGQASWLKLAGNEVISLFVHICDVACGMVKLQVYNTSLDLCVELYRFVQSQQLRTDYALSTQLRRAAISIPANISEGYLRSKKMFSNHLSIAIGSSNEVQTLLTLSSRIYQLDPSQLILDYEVLSKQLMTLRNRLH